MKTFYLVDYKGKFTIAQDKLRDLDYEVGKISKKDLIEQVEYRKSMARHYGVPAVITKDKEINKLYETNTNNNNNL